MISKKMTELGTKRSVIREIFEYGNARRAEIGAENVLDFSLGNPSIPAPEAFKEAMLELLGGDAVALHGYTSAAGDMGVRRAIADSINARYEGCADAGLIYMTCGAAASLTVSLGAIINEGDEVIVLAPFFPEYRVFCEKAGAKVVPVLCPPPEFLPDVAAVEAAVTSRTKAVIINSPNNPTGVIIPKERLCLLAEMLTRKQQETGNDIYIIADEPYRELSYGKEVPYIPEIYDNTIVCYSYSKSLSLPGERIGYISVPPRAKDTSTLFAAICGAGRALGFVCAPSLMQYAVGKCIGLSCDIEAYKKNRDLLYGALCDMGYSAVCPDGAFYIFLKSPIDDASEFCERAKKYELLLVPSESFGCDGYVRIAYCVRYEQLERSLPAFKKLFEECKNG